MDDLALIFSHPHKSTSTSPIAMQENNNEEDEQAAALACIISFSSNVPNYSQHSAMCNINHHHNFEPSLLIPKAEANNTCSTTISFSQINEKIGAHELQFGGNYTTRTREQAQEHLLAERNRRRKIAKLFVSLASLLPGLNKMDKASILEGASSLIRELRERAETVQHHHLYTKPNNEKIAKKARNYENQSSIDMMSTLPEVEVRNLEEELLITILYCKKQQKGNIDEILSVIQKFHLTIKSSNFMPFGSSTVHITVIAQMNDEFCETTDYLAEKLRLSIIKV
ncbi:hypothetical protein K7X08_006704 [Anisodus acutangulus]|uniref:BHLH domain-containing protein n=1 Tax=Anisodus acutangulus TaxID=402998 RepID=A0A9Q1MWB0_9SOLA|nr:hypothetical protein K7X08_006704 [Anisodus acutangulus]